MCHSRGDFCISCLPASEHSRTTVEVSGCQTVCLRYFLNLLFLHFPAEEATLTESIELRALGPINSTDTDPGLVADSEADPFNDNKNPQTLGTQSPWNAHEEVVIVSGGLDGVVAVQSPPSVSVVASPPPPPVISSNRSDRRDTLTSGEPSPQTALLTATTATAVPLDVASAVPVSSSCASPVSPFRHSSLGQRNGSARGSPMTLSPPVRRSPSYMRSMNRIPSDHSIQSSLSTDKDDSRSTPRAHKSNTLTSNLRDELLNCEQKELFQFLQDDFNDNSNNYFSDTVGYGAAVMDADTDSLVFDGRGAEESLSSDRKVSTGSLRSNLSNISNSIFQTLEMRRGGSFSGSIDKVFSRLESPNMRAKFGDNHSHKDVDREPLVGNSEFDCLIESFDKSLTNLKKQSSLSLDRNAVQNLPSPGTPMNTDDLSKSNSSSNNSGPDVVTVIRRPRSGSARSFDRTSNSVKLKRRSLEKQKKVHDEEFEPVPEGHPVSRENELKSPPSSASPTMRIRRSFNHSYDRIKRSSLIERVEEDVEGEKPPVRSESEKLPRKEFKIVTEEPLKRHRSTENVKTPDLEDFAKHPEEQKLLLKTPSHDRPQHLVDPPTESPSVKSSKSAKSSSTSSKKSKKSKKSPKPGKRVDP